MEKNTQRFITKMYKFDCSHRLTLPYDSPCSSLHGHSYKLKSSVISDNLLETGMIIDFGELKKFQTYLDTYYDHGTIVNHNDKRLLKFLKDNNQKYLVYDKNPTAENMAEELCYDFADMFESKILNLSQIKIEIWETDKNSAGFILNF